MTNHRQRASRARARTAARKLTTGLSLTEAVPCAHGPGLKHNVRMEVSHEGVITHVSSECTERAPSKEELAVTRGLLLEDMYCCCTDVVDTIINRVALAYKRERNAWLLRAQGKNTDDRQLPPLITAAVYAAAEHSKKIQEERAANPYLTGDAMAAVQKLMGHNMRADRLLRGVVAPPKWRLNLSYETAYDEEENRKYSRLKVSICPGAHTDFHPVATYRGWGRFVMHTKNIKRLSDGERSYYVNRNSDGKYPCHVCGTAVTNIGQHNASKRHQSKVEIAVFNICEQIGEKLQRRNREQR